MNDPSDDPHYLALLHVPAERTVEVGALGTYDVPPGDYAYVGRAKTGYDARLARHRRTDDKAIRWHVDYLREASRWVEARTPDAASECALVDRLAAREGARRFIEGFGASDCNCRGHLVKLGDSVDSLPGDLWAGDGIEAAFVDRPNRFVMRVGLPDGSTARAFLPNTSRLTELLDPGRPVLLSPADDPSRKTDYTVTRIWDGAWVSLEATRAETMIEDFLERRGGLPGLGPAADWETQIERADHRFDFRLHDDDGRDVWLEVKSLSRNFDGTAVLSGTPSKRAVAHLDTLAQFAESGERAAVAFVLQHGGARRLLVGDPGLDASIDADWIDAVRRARDSGVDILAYGCRITPSNSWIVRRVSVEDIENQTFDNG